MKKTLTIKAEMRKTFFAAEEHIAITIDDETLDVMIDEFYPDEEYLGLVPAFLPVYESDAEYDLVMERALPKEGETLRIPLLVCPEDLDLVCTVIVAHAKTEGDYVIWESLGVDIHNPENHPQSVGSKVKWLNKIKPMYFKKDEYITCLNTFKELAEE